MGDSSAIQWTDATWNPVTGCSKVSPGCAHCYAERVAIRLWPSQYPQVVDFSRHIAPGSMVHPTRPRQFTDVQCQEDRLDQPLRWKKPRKIFVNSMSDLFHEDVPDAFIDRVFAVMALAPQHTFQILTKRAERMLKYFNARREQVLTDRPSTETTMWHVWAATAEFARHVGEAPWNWKTVDANEVDGPWPLSNVWLGVSVENQHFADERIPLLLQTPAAVRFLSCEPLLEGLDLAKHRPGANRLWVIVGGESGSGARPCDVQWVRSIVRQCRESDAPVFVKQLGARPTGWWSNSLGPRIGRFKDSHGGDMAEWPEDLRVREMPA